MKWPWQRAEKRESSFTYLLVSLAVSRARGTTTANVGAVGALQAAAGLVSGWCPGASRRRLSRGRRT